jgi:hypothetical protein
MRSLLLSCLLGLGAAAALAQPVSEAPPSAIVLNDSDNIFSTPEVAFDAQGNQVVVWRRFHLDDRDGDVLMRRYDGAGAPLGPETQVNVDEADDHNSPRVAAARAASWWSGPGRRSQGCQPIRKAPTRPWRSPHPPTRRPSPEQLVSQSGAEGR